MDPEARVINNLLEFLKRIPLKGEEAPALMECVAHLTKRQAEIAKTPVSTVVAP